MKTSLKAGFAQIFFCCPKNYEFVQDLGACSPPRPLAPPARTPMLVYNYNKKMSVSAFRKMFSSLTP